ncbi:MAG: DUF503 domain-containing protein [Candidatus Omnitrophota bacterium]|nr:MAG: DUF503 domain-containing protein [Candidatus Omnitrophota bacterium]
MTIGILKVSIWVPESNSLKTKRMVLHSIKAQLRNRFNVAVTQIADEDKWQKATLAIVGVEKTKAHMNSILSRISDFLGGFGNFELIDHCIELI